MTENHVVKKLIRLIREGTSPYHVTANLERQFQKAGYKPLLLACPWRLQGGGCYYTVIQESALIAFSVGERMQTNALRIAAAHTDFPGLRLKQKPGLVRKGCAQLNVEVYGGAILNTWLDRPLSIAGRVSLRGGDVFHPVTRLVDFEKPLFVIPNLAIHLNREVNKGTELNRQKEMLPVAGIFDDGMTETYFQKLLAGKLEVEEEEILDYELGLYNRDQPEYVGFDERSLYLSAPRVDNLSGVQAVASGMMQGGRDGINVAAFFDHEEVGSRTKQGAGSLILSMVLEKIMNSLGAGRVEFLESLSEGMFLSVDVGHAYHPNYPEKMDLTNQSPLNHGLCIKEACSQSYATDSRAIAVIQQICEKEGISCTKYFNRSDGTSGGTLGSIASAMVPMPTVDVGIPILAMHSARELMGVEDECALSELIRAYYTL
ncbi:MAG: M18 family aminopeptidase [Lachnospiraceae bacterium]|nr:M18 family aminopeptidase [Lachnospiraceae bacterium]